MQASEGGLCHDPWVEFVLLRFCPSKRSVLDLGTPASSMSRSTPNVKGQSECADSIIEGNPFFLHSSHSCEIYLHWLFKKISAVYLKVNNTLSVILIS